MRTRLLVTAVGFALTGLLSAPAVAGAQTAGQDSVSGSARNCPSPQTCTPEVPLPFVSLTADAVSGPTGQNAAGTMIWTERMLGLLTVDEARVSCLSVAGNVAIVGFAGTRTLTFLPGTITVPMTGFIRVVDGGGPNSGLDTFESDIRLDPIPVPPAPPPPPVPAPTDCSAFPAGGTVARNNVGDLVVHDAPPLPTSKGQCKNGGWRDFGVFKNQGDCVSFVATGRKTPP